MGRPLLTRSATAMGVLACAVGCALVTYPRWRPWCLTWGAVGDEALRELPGDQLLGRPDIVTTRGVGIDAPPSAVWPWIVQMGPGRAGAYTYDWIENLAGLDMHSADSILPELQHIEVGDAWRLGTRGPVLRVASLDPGSALVLRSDDGNWVWAFVLEKVGASTRLLSRNRISQPGASRLARACTRYLMEPGSLVMERKMLLGIKERAERATGLERDAGQSSHSAPTSRQAADTSTGSTVARS